MTGREALYEFRAGREDAPLDLLYNSSTWRPVITLIDLWARQPLTDRSGYSTEELNAIERNEGVLFPMVVREWWRLAGKHPFVDPGLGEVSFFCLPPHTGVAEGAKFRRVDGLTIVTIEDDQSGNETGIHDDFIHELDPPSHGRNPNVDPGAISKVGTYRGQFFETGSDLPSLIYTTLLWHICGIGRPHGEILPGALRMECNGRVYGVDGDNGLQLSAGRIDHAALIEELSLTKFFSITWAEVFTDGSDIIYWPVSGYLLRTKQAFDRVRSAVELRRE